MFLKSKYFPAFASESSSLCFLFILFQPDHFMSTNAAMRVCELALAFGCEFYVCGDVQVAVHLFFTGEVLVLVQKY